MEDAAAPVSRPPRLSLARCCAPSPSASPARRAWLAARRRVVAGAGRRARAARAWIRSGAAPPPASARRSPAEAAPATPAPGARPPTPAAQPRAAPGRRRCTARRPVPGGHHLRERTSARRSSRPSTPCSSARKAGPPRSSRSTSHRRGNPGHRVVAPFYWHFWSPEGKSQRRRPVLLALRGLPGPAGGDGHPALLAHHPARRRVLGDLAALLPLDQVRLGGPAAALVQDREPRRAAVAAACTPCCTSGSATAQAGTAFDLFFPLFVSSRSPDRAFTWALPLNFYWRRRATALSNLLVLPLLYRSRTPRAPPPSRCWATGTRAARTATGRSLWLYWYGRGADGGGYDLLLPLFYWSRRPPAARWARRSATTRATGRTSAGRWPGCTGSGASSRRRSASYDVAVPAGLELPLARSRTPRSCRPFLHLRRPTYSFTTRVPALLGRRRTPSAGTAWRLLFPLYFSRTGERGPDLHLADAAGRLPPRRRRGHAHAHAAGAAHRLPPRSPARAGHGAAASYWRYREPADGATTTLLAALLPRAAIPQGSTTTLFPLFWHFRDAATGATAHTLLPVLLPPQLARRDR